MEAIRDGKRIKLSMSKEEAREMWAAMMNSHSDQIRHAARMMEGLWQD